MNDILGMILIGTTYLIVYALYLIRKGGDKWKKGFQNQDWISLITLYLGLVVVMSALNASGILPHAIFSRNVGAYLLFAALLFLGLFLQRAKTGEIWEDERTSANYAKSARNALFVTYVGLVIYLLAVNANSLETKWVLNIISGGVFIFFVSETFYFLKKP